MFSLGEVAPLQHERAQNDLTTDYVTRGKAFSGLAGDENPGL